MRARPGMPFTDDHSTPAASTADHGRSGDLVIRGGHVLTMDDELGDHPVADVLIRDGAVVAIGADLDAQTAQVVDARDMIVMPGFVDTHSHLWNAFLRGSVRGDDPVHGYFPVTNAAAPMCTPQDVYISGLFGTAQELLSGITTINNYSHNTRSPDHADAEIRAMLESGVRGRFSYGPAGPGSGSVDMADVARVQRQWLPGNPQLTLGVNLNKPTSTATVESYAAQVAAARRIGVPVSAHFANPAPGVYRRVQELSAFGPDVLVIHPQGYDAEDRQILAGERVKVSTSPAIEIPYSTVRDGYIQFAELEQLGVPMSLSLDATSASANADFFTVMRALLWSHKQRSDTTLKLLPRRIVQLATIDGARALALDHEVGSITPGKRADVILVRKNDPNMLPVYDPYFSLVYSGLPSNVDTVLVDGNIIVRHGQLTTLDLDTVARETTASAARIDAARNASTGR
jgi:5-methylthioadenosine/S-adenosylhomocysteine deaminase